MSFIEGNLEKADTRKRITMLVRNRTLKKMKLVIIYVDPWKDIDAEKEEFDLPENIFLVNSDISFQ